MKNLQLSLVKKWFDMTKAGVKTEDYRDINEYWIKRLMTSELEDLSLDDYMFAIIDIQDGYDLDHIYNVHGIYFKPFDCNTMTLGYPKANDCERILKLEHKGIEIREGNPEWGAVPGKVYFVIKHGERII